MNSILEETKFLIKKYHINANKSLGQNFLIDDEAVDTIISSAQINENDLIIEIGPGLGTLTAKLLERAGKVISIELDDRMINILQDRFQFYDNFELLHQDVLKVDFKQLIENEQQKKQNIGTNIVLEQKIEENMKIKNELNQEGKNIQLKLWQIYLIILLPLLL